MLNFKGHVIATLAASITLMVLVACSGGANAVDSGDGPGPARPPVVGAGPSVSPSPAEPVRTPTEIRMVEVLAPILSADVLTAESFPPQYFLEIQSSLPNGCFEFDAYDVGRDGGTIKVKVTNLKPADENIACTDQLRTVKTSVRLGSGADFDDGTKYTVLVNDFSTTFVTQGVAPPADQVAATLGSPFQLKVGQTALIGRQGPHMEFVEIVEDSRCATGLTCIWAGRARVRIKVSSPGDVLGFGTRDLTLEAGMIDADADTLSGASEKYVFELSALDPYPAVGASQPPDYTATLVVSKAE